jgi:organic hydroperoxide reductase OsmC/OhrA
MQKEALVAAEGGGVWRLACDEGHYLNGTDLAPPPLDFFSAGMQFAVMSAALEEARSRDVTLGAIRLLQDNVYEISGSFLRGDARGTARPPKLHLVLERPPRADLSPALLGSIARDALRRATALALARDVLANRFGLTVRGRPVPLAAMKEIPRAESVAAAAVAELFRRFRADSSSKSTEPAIVKTSQAERVENHRDGAGVGLKAEQKRTIHIRSRGEWTGDDSFVVDVDLLQPIGSSFRFRSELLRPGAQAPPPDAFVASGVALCFMTQLGRYAAIRKSAIPVEAYSVLQTGSFGLAGGNAVARPLDTAVFVETDAPSEASADLVRTGERTCFLHACMRTNIVPEVTLEVDGESVSVAT